MEEPTTEDLATHVREALRDASTPPWFPKITAVLVDAAWRKLGPDLGLTRDSYGTARVLRQDPGAARQVVALFKAPSHQGRSLGDIAVEWLPEDLARQYGGEEVRFFSADEILKAGVASRVEQALEILDTVPTVRLTIGALIRALHLIDPIDDEVDISFSEPRLPFSAFVSIPGPGAAAGALRIAEALLHEAMHLQLTLIEAAVPLVLPTQTKFFSPWRSEYRTVQGVLHALYVFRAIDAFLAAVPFKGPALSSLQRYATERRTTIARQVRQVRDFGRCTDLTADGAAFASRLIG
jgi:HEXXH motif-containing protein